MSRKRTSVGNKLVMSVLLLAGTAVPAYAEVTPIKHVVVIFQENVSFDHYFATYPNAINAAGQPAFTAQPGTPSVNGLTAALIAFNTNSAKPFRLDRAQAATCDQDHVYKDEQAAMNSGLMDKFVEKVGTGTLAKSGNTVCHATDVMGYFDGNTVTALWNYAQEFAMSDNFFGTTFGPSTPGALNLISGQTNGATGSCALEPASAQCVAAPDSLPTKFGVDVVQGSVVADPQPMFDDCSSRETVAMSGHNVGDLLSAKGITWGFFQGGFRPTSVVNGKAVCGASHVGSNGNTQADYIPHHQPFQYFQSTANPHHLPPSSVAMIGRSDQANHQYDIIDFWNAVNADNLPAVSFLKAPGSGRTCGLLGPTSGAAVSRHYHQQAAANAGLE